MFGVRGKEEPSEEGREGGNAPQAARGEEIHLEIIAMQNASTSCAYGTCARPRKKKSQTGIGFGCSCGNIELLGGFFNVLFGCVARRH